MIVCGINLPWSGRNNAGEPTQVCLDGRWQETEIGCAGGEDAQVAPAALEDSREYVGHITEGIMINAAITIGFIGLVVLLGKHLFNVKDWGREVRKDAPSGIVQGKYLPPVFLRSRGINKVDMQAYRAFHARHDVMSAEEFSDMIERS